MEPLPDGRRGSRYNCSMRVRILAEPHHECFPGENKLDSTKEDLKGGTTVAERRKMKRHAFSATTEVADLATGARLTTRAADLSLQGCYLDSLNPFAIGSQIQVRITWGGAELKCKAVVRDSKPGMGMGVAFTDLDDARRSLIEKWIEQLDPQAQADLAMSSPSENLNSKSLQDARESLALKLIDLLHKKGLLNANDVASLFRDQIF